MPKLEDIDVEIVDLPNIREFYDEQEEDLLGDSLLKGQQSPIIVGPLIGGRRKVFDGSRRVRAARKKAIKKLLGMVLDREPTPEELAQFQLISDIHKKHLTPYERSMAILDIESPRREALAVGKLNYGGSRRETVILLEHPDGGFIVPVIRPRLGREREEVGLLRRPTGADQGCCLVSPD